MASGTVIGLAGALPRNPPLLIVAMVCCVVWLVILLRMLFTVPK